MVITDLLEVVVEGRVGPLAVVVVGIERLLQFDLSFHPFLQTLMNE